MMDNIFRKILQELSYPDTKVIAKNPEDQRTADQMGALLNYELYEERIKIN